MSRFLQMLARRALVLDGSMGALIQRRGLPAGMAPDVWMLDYPEVIEGVHREYVEAGADIVLTNTFGATKWRLEEYNAYAQLPQINSLAVKIARKAAGTKAFVAGNIGPSGDTVFPTGSKSFEEVCDVFYEQAKVLVELDVDVIAVETMFDSLELRCALSAVRAASSTIPLIAHATFNTDGITDTGASPENVAAIAEGFHAHVVGVNCSTGPEPMVEIVRRMANTTSLYVSVEPNAGLPCIQDGHTHFPLTPHEMAPYVKRFLQAGARIIGGCCGTTPQYIALVKSVIEQEGDKPFVVREELSTRVLVSSLSSYTLLGGDSPFLAIGERMNPSGRKALSVSLKEGDLSKLLEDAAAQSQAGARMLDLNVGVPLIDEVAMMKRAVVAVQNGYPTIPLMIDSANSFALDAGASVYYGRPLLNSVNIEEEKLEEMAPIIRKHGAAMVCMLTGVEVPVKAEQRLQYARMLVDELKHRCGLQERDIVFDCLGLVVSAMREGSRETLRTIRLMKEHFPAAATTLGLSNTSFGLPNRKFVHGAFLAAACAEGLDSAIMSVTDSVGLILASSGAMWSPKAQAVEQFIETWQTPLAIGGSSSAVEAKTEKVTGPGEPEWLKARTPLEQSVFRGIVDGDKGKVEALATELTIAQPEASMTLFMEIMTPAIRHLGDLFAARVKFIPHLIAAADAMKAGVKVLEPFLMAERAKNSTPKETIVFATVKGDIHDIGKNICVLMLRNFGYEVIDLGRNVDAELILQTAIEKNAKVVALSALMTTTMMQMKVVIDAVQARQLPFKVVIGGAVVTPEFAKEIAADGFSTDVGTVVSEMERVIHLLEAVQKTGDNHASVARSVCT